MHAIMVDASSYAECLVWRQNVGLAVPYRLAVLGEMVPIQFGVEGMADIGMVYRGRAVQIETKSKTGKQREAQGLWQKAVERAGGFYVIARSLEDWLEARKRIDAIIDQRGNLT